MKKLFYFAAIIFAAMFISCGEEYDDSAIWNEFDKVYNQIEELKEVCRQMNTNISSLQTLINALNQKEYITNIAPITKNGAEIGYSITFTSGKTITIYHGKDGADGKDGINGENGADGKDGSTPIIGVKKDSDNIYYWTLNGEWLLDDDGNKIKAVGTDGKDGQNGADGKDGITPQLKIEEGYWYISYDNGSSWKQLGKATGEDGKDGQDGADGADGKDGDSFFQNVTQDDEYVYFTLADGTQISILKASAISSIEISYVPRYDDGKATVVFTTAEDSKIEMDFQIMPKSAATIIAKDWKNTLSLKAVETQTRAVEYIDMPISKCTVDATNGTITITASGKNLPQTFFDAETKVRAALFYENSIGGAVSEYVELVAKLGDLPESEIDNNKIIYTAFDEIIPFADDVFGANIVSNEWDPSTGEGVITFDADVTEIGYNAFMYCNSLENITIPNSVTAIGSYAFYYCSSLKSITIPDGITEIGDSAFDYCSSLNAFYGKFATADNKALVIDGVLNAFAIGCGATSYSIPDNVIRIGKSAFASCSSLKSVTIPDNVNEISTWAFENCSNLSSITIPDSVTSIGSRAFSNCSSLSTFYGKFATADNKALVVDGVLSAFAIGCGAAAYTIPDSVTEIERSAFAYCNSLTSVVIPDNVIKIGEWAFSDCSNLTNVKIGSGVTMIEDYVFYRCSQLRELYCKSLTPSNVKKNGASYWSAFRNNASDRKIYVPAESVNAYKEAEGWNEYADAIIADNSGSGEQSPTKPANNEILYIATSKVTPAAPSAFGAKIVSYEWDSATGEGVITFDADVTTIGNSAFYGCNNLTSITIPDSVTEIGSYAFWDCSSLTSVAIPNSVDTIGQNAFLQCYSLASITIPDSVTTIGSGAFAACSSLTGITIPDSVTTIGSSAFSGCKSLTSITIPDSVTTIGIGAFRGCI